MNNNNNNNANNDTIELIEEYLNTNKTNEICTLINSMSDKLWCFSLRKCSMRNDSDFEKMIRSLKNCKSTLCYLNFNLSLINSISRATYLTTLLPSLSNLHTLSLHSSNLKDEGLKLLYYSLINNSNFKSLDIGDCKLTDKSVEFIRELIHRREHDYGLNELIISSNPKISLTGWSQILISVASASDLEHFYLDFNNLDDSCGYLIAAMLSANHMLKTLDLEHTGLTNKTASLLLYMFRNYQLLTIKSLNLINNNIDERFLKEMQTFTTENMNITNILPKENESHLVEESIVLNDSCDLKMRDQLKLDEYIRNGQKLDFNNLSLVSDYEKKLEQDFRSLLNEKNKNDRKQQRKNSSEAEECEDEVLQPVKNSDQRYKTHTVLPMNYLE